MKKEIEPMLFTHTGSCDSSFVNTTHDFEDVPPLRFRAPMQILVDVVNTSKEPGDKAHPRWSTPWSSLELMVTCLSPLG